jgi:hypothetical protein
LGAEKKALLNKVSLISEGTQIDGDWEQGAQEDMWEYSEMEKIT